jgi:hypothetical protein
MPVTLYPVCFYQYRNCHCQNYFDRIETLQHWGNLLGDEKINGKSFRLDRKQEN